MIFFITVLRALAACLITNAHYEGIYPTDLIANGGLIGDVIFFAVSGYCLCNIKHPLSAKGFISWYGKRLWRVYPPVVVCTLIYFLLGAYDFSIHGFVWWIVYPTYYHFIASIILLYIPFFFFMKIDVLRRNIGKIMIAIAAIWAIVYCFFYDKSYYHIDSVYEPMIRFLFMESMLVGAWFRINDKRIRNCFKIVYPIVTILLFAVYFISKKLFSTRVDLSQFQILNQIIIFALLFFIFRSFSGIDCHLSSLPRWIKKMIEFVSSITLEIYVVQYVLIDLVREWGISFPANWLILTASIIFTAFVLHLLCKCIYKGGELLIRRLKK